MQTQILKIASELFNHEVTQDMKLGDIENWDSLGQINLFMALESELGLNFSPDEVIENNSIEKIFDLVKKKTDEKSI